MVTFKAPKDMSVEESLRLYDNPALHSSYYVTVKAVTRRQQNMLDMLIAAKTAQDLGNGLYKVRREDAVKFNLKIISHG